LAFSPTDVTIPAQVSASLDEAERVFGEPVNAGINCAGIAHASKTLSKRGPHSIEMFARTLTVNTVGSFTVASLAAERMSRRQTDEDGLRGCIINTASIAAFEGQIGQVAYAASKGGVVGMTLPMARDLATYGIRVMTIVRWLLRDLICLIYFRNLTHKPSRKSRRQDCLQLLSLTDFPKT
jgi:3-hydroxyacyl-CoA dehydrogenase / 3-hydroxy-2-methylbutyryl-CoA dehydrogenase